MNERISHCFKELKKQGATLGVAESCTGGLLSAQFTDLPGASEVFWGTIVCYANSVKVELLGVSENHLRTYGAVSTEVASDMARGARKQLRTTWSLAITGVAGPDGGSFRTPVGTVCFGICGPEFEEVRTCHFKGDRRHVREAATDMALSILERALLKKKG